MAGSESDCYSLYTGFCQAAIAGGENKFCKSLQTVETGGSG